MQETAPKPQPELTAKPPEGTDEFASLEASVAPDGSSVIHGVDSTGARSELLKTPPSDEGKEDSLPEDLNQYSRLDAMVAKDGSRRVYGVDADTGKKSQLKGDDVLNAYGYSPDEVKDNNPKDLKEDGTKGEINVRPVKEGELTETAEGYEEDQQNDGISADSLATMGHEPWTLDEEKEDKEPKDPGGPKDPPSGGGPSEPPSGGGEGGDPDEEEPGPEDPLGGPGGSEDPGERENPFGSLNHENPDNEPRKKIGETVSMRVMQRRAQGESESDAHAEAHDEFWGRETSEEEPSITTPETITSPELQAAEAKVKEAREEYARRRAGREGATFFSFKFSARKVEEAKEAYEQAKAEAGSIAIDLLRERGLKGEQLVGMIHKGALDEEFSLIDKQYELEKAEVEGKRLKRFYSWWKDQGTKLFSVGTLKKGAAMSVITAPIGIGASIIAAPVLAGAGLAAAGGVGLAVARSASRGVIGNRIRKNANAGEMTETKRDARKEQAAALIESLNTHKAQVAEDFDKSLEEMGTDRYKSWDSGVISPAFGIDQRKQTAEQKRDNDKDARNSMIAGAAGALLGYAVAEGVAHFWPGGGPKPPSDFDLNKSLYKGITMEPGASGRFGNLIENAQANGIGPDNALANSFRGAAETLNDSQKDVLGTVLGRLADTPSYGNAWSIEHMDELAKMASEGQSASDILSNLFK